MVQNYLISLNSVDVLQTFQKVNVNFAFSSIQTVVHVFTLIYTWKIVREHLLYNLAKLWTNIFLHSKRVLTKLFK